MGYPMGLDEYPETRLEDELETRRHQRQKGMCDYCGRSPRTRSCKFPQRHEDPRIAASTPCPHCDGTGAPQAIDESANKNHCQQCQGRGIKR